MQNLLEKGGTLKINISSPHADFSFCAILWGSMDKWTYMDRGGSPTTFSEGLKLRLRKCHHRHCAITWACWAFNSYSKHTCRIDLWKVHALDAVGHLLPKSIRHPYKTYKTQRRKRWEQEKWKNSCICCHVLCALARLLHFKYKLLAVHSWHWDHSVYDLGR